MFPESHVTAVTGVFPDVKRLNIGLWISVVKSVFFVVVVGFLGWKTGL